MAEGHQRRVTIWLVGPRKFSIMGFLTGIAEGENALAAAAEGEPILLTSRGGTGIGCGLDRAGAADTEAEPEDELELADAALRAATKLAAELEELAYVVRDAAAASAALAAAAISAATSAADGIDGRIGTPRRAGRGVKPEPLLAGTAGGWVGATGIAIERGADACGAGDVGARAAAADEAFEEDPGRAAGANKRCAPENSSFGWSPPRWATKSRRGPVHVHEGAGHLNVAAGHSSLCAERRPTVSPFASHPSGQVAGIPSTILRAMNEGAYFTLA